MKGQAAIEYLTTYGWAILALVAVLGIILYSGVLSPTYLLSDECSISSNIPCKFAIESTADKSTLKLSLTNGFQYRIKVTDVSVSARDGSLKGFSKKVGTEIESGANILISEDLGQALPANSVVRLNVNLTYASCAPELVASGKTCSDSNHTVVGKITGRVIPG